MLLVAGIDSSTQGCKVVVVDAQSGQILREGRAPHPDGTTVDPEAWWAALQAAIAAAGGLHDVSAVGVAGQQHGLVALDESGRVIRPAILWNDTRSAQAAADLVNEVGAAEYAERTGSVPVASFTATKLRWMADHEPANAARIAAIALPHDWLIWRLRGYGPAGSNSPLGADLEELITDRSEASGTGYFNSRTNSYDRKLLALALRRDSAPAIVLPRVLGPAEQRPGEDWVVSAGAGDNASAGLGLGLAPGDVAVSIGTSGTAFTTSTAFSPDSSGTVATFADATGAFLPIVTTLNAARVLDVVADLLGVDHDGLGKLALAASPGAGGLLLQPWFDGERTPNRPSATATLFNMTRAATTRENLARAAIEAVLASLAHGIDVLAAHSADPSRILLIGGAAQNSAVQQIAAEVFEVPIVVPTPREYVALGAASQAAWALTGQRTDWPLQVARRLTPNYVPEIREGYESKL